MSEDASQSLGKLIVSKCQGPGKYRLGTKDGAAFNFTRAFDLDSGTVTLEGVTMSRVNGGPTKVGKTLIVLDTVCWILVEPS